MKYTAKYFKDSMPEWKRKKDTVVGRIFYRPISFLGARIVANFGISANSVSYFSAALGVVACCLFLPDNHVCHIIGALLINFWLICDCIDGNLARSVEKQLFGEFADGISSYILVGLMCTMMSVAVYFDGGLFVPAKTPWIILIGALASSSDSLMRLIYQKYKNAEHELVENGIISPEEDARTNHEQVGSLRVRIETDLGIAGILPPAILIAAIFNALDVIVLYCFFYYGGACLITSLTYIGKAVRIAAKQGKI